MSFAPYIGFSGQAREAMTAYAAIFGATDLQIMGFGEGGMGGSSVFHAAPDAARAAEVFAALSDGGAVTMMLAPTFWSPTFGMLVDQWGTRWMISVATDAA